MMSEFRIRFPLPDGRMVRRESYMDVRLRGSEEWLLATLSYKEAWFGLFSKWQYAFVFRYDEPRSVDGPLPPMIGVLTAADQVRTPRHPAFVSGATHAIADEMTLDSVCRALLCGGRRRASRVIEAWGRDGRLGPGPARDLPRSQLTYDENALLDLALTLWTWWGGKPQSGVITHECLMWLALEYLPKAAEFVRTIAADREAQRRRSTPEWVEMQYAIASSDRDLFDSLVADNPDLAVRRLRRLSPAVLRHIAGLLEAMTAGPEGLMSWLTACR